MSSRRNAPTIRGPYTCTYFGCTQRFDTPTLLHRHKRESHREAQLGPLDTPHGWSGPSKCEDINPSTRKPCSTVFSRPYDLARHKDTIHKIGKHKARCHICTEEKTFSRADALQRHYRVCHPGQFPGERHAQDVVSDSGSPPNVNNPGKTHEEIDRAPDTNQLLGDINSREDPVAHLSQPDMSCNVDTPPIKTCMSRNGCASCTERHMRCDENFPQCKNCTKSKILCHYNDLPVQETGSYGIPNLSPRDTSSGSPDLAAPTLQDSAEMLPPTSVPLFRSPSPFWSTCIQRSNSVAGSTSSLDSVVSKASQRSWEEEDQFDQVFNEVARNIDAEFNTKLFKGSFDFKNLFTKDGRSRREIQRGIKKELAEFSGKIRDRANFGRAGPGTNNSNEYRSIREAAYRMLLEARDAILDDLACMKKVIASHSLEFEHIETFHKKFERYLELFDAIAEAIFNPMGTISNLLGRDPSVKG